MKLKEVHSKPNTVSPSPYIHQMRTEREERALSYFK